MRKINFNLKLSLAALTLLSANAWGDDEHGYVCETTLEYKVVNARGDLEIRSIPMKVEGFLSDGPGLSGEAYVVAGARSSSYNSAVAYVSEDYIDVDGGLANGEAFSVLYRGEEETNWATYTVLHNGRDFTATNDKLSTEEVGDKHPVLCTIY